jgi:hypothetical protein
MTNRVNSLPPGWSNVKRYAYDTYRTRDGEAFFEFRFVDVGSKIEIDISHIPSYGDRSRDPHKTHRLPSSRGGEKICVGDESAINSFSVAKKTAMAWAEQTWRYIKTGRSFDNK